LAPQKWQRFKKTSHSIHLNETVETEQISGVLCWNFVDEVFAANLDLFVFRSDPKNLQSGDCCKIKH